MSRPRHIVFLVFPGFQMLDLTGPMEVFCIASRGPKERYRVSVVSARGGSVAASSGLAVETRAPRAAADAIDTLIAVGGLGVQASIAEGATVRLVERSARRARRVCSVCTGTFLLAEAGLLRGRRVTTHWDACRALQERHPELQVDPDPIFVKDGRFWTSAGVTAGMDLALALVEEDLGAELALDVARSMVLFLRRPGGQSQFSAQLASQQSDRQPLRDLQAWILEHPDGDLSVAAMAERVHMSPRNFGRVFRREVGQTPAHFVERIRLEAAQRHLLAGDASLAEIAQACGFGTVETLHRAFRRALDVTPAHYRRSFREPSSRLSEETRP